MDPLNTRLKVDHWLEHVSMEQLVALQKKAYRIFYLRPSAIWRQLKQIKSLYEIKVKIKGALSVLGLHFGALKSKPLKPDYQVPIK